MQGSASQWALRLDLKGPTKVTHAELRRLTRAPVAAVEVLAGFTTSVSREGRRSWPVLYRAYAHKALLVTLAEGDRLTLQPIKPCTCYLTPLPCDSTSP